MFFWNTISNFINTNNKYIDLRRILSNPKGDLYKESVIDMSVYSKTQPFRTILSCKAGSDRYLLPVKYYNNNLKKIKKGQYNIANYLVYSETDKYYEDDIIPTELISKNRIKRVFIDKQSTIEYIVENYTKNWKYATTRAGYYILERTSKNAVCPCGIIHPTQNKSYIYTKNNQYIWKCYNNPSHKILYEKSTDIVDDIEYYYTYYRKLLQKKNTIQEIQTYLKNVFIVIDNEQSILLKKIKKIEYLSLDVFKLLL